MDCTKTISVIADHCYTVNMKIVTVSLLIVNHSSYSMY